jgi:TRAP-type mannitol/chloroaromatic compound transport system substrate-binding protein
MSGGDIFPSLERQVIDATEFSMPAIDRMMGFEAIAKHYYVPGWHQPTTFHELLINAETWEGLSDAQRTLIEMACRDATLWTRTMTLKDNGEALAHFEGEGVTIREFPDEVLDTLRQTVDEVIADERARDEGFKAGYDSLQSFLETTRPWRERNTLQ